MRQQRRVEPLIWTWADSVQSHNRLMLRFQWFALGVAATCFLLAFSLPGFWQTAAVMFIVAVVISTIRRRLLKKCVGTGTWPE